MSLKIDLKFYSNLPGAKKLTDVGNKTKKYQRFRNILFPCDTLQFFYRTYSSIGHSIIFQCIVQGRYDAVSFLPNPHYKHPTGRGKDQFVSLNSELNSASVNAVLFEMTCFDAPRLWYGFNNPRLIEHEFSYLTKNI